MSHLNEIISIDPETDDSWNRVVEIAYKRGKALFEISGVVYVLPVEELVSGEAS